MKSKKINWLHIAISWGASIVILGAMFKINHWGGQGGTYMIGLGLAVEAVLFFTLGFFPPAEELEWEKVYPELAADYPGGPRKSEAQNRGNIAALDKLMGQSQLTPESIDKLGEGIKQFGEKMGRINTVADASLGTDDFMDKLKRASSKIDLMGVAFERASAGFASIEQSGSSAQAYQQQVSKLAVNIAQLNALYETELEGAGTSLRKINTFYDGLAKTLSSMNDSAEETQAFKGEINKLTKNISALNVYYANMLSAMTQPRL